MELKPVGEDTGVQRGLGCRGARKGKEAGQKGRVPPFFPLPCHLFNSVVITGKVPLNQILC